MATNVSLLTPSQIPAAKRNHLFSLPGDECDTFGTFEACAVDGAGIQISRPTSFYRGLLFALGFELCAAMFVAASVCLLRH
jgi:hypothetical protein